MPNPAFNAAGGAAAAVAAGIPAQITHTDHVISARAENNIKLAAYFLRFKERTSRAPDTAVGKALVTSSTLGTAVVMYVVLL